MANNTNLIIPKQHKANYLVSTFLASEKAYEIDLHPFDVNILYTMARYLDMPLNMCCLKQPNFAKECRIGLTPFKERTLFLFENKIIFRFMRGKLYRYELGEVITGMVNN